VWWGRFRILRCVHGGSANRAQSTLPRAIVSTTRCGRASKPSGWKFAIKKPSGERDRFVTHSPLPPERALNRPARAATL
jgi:hypothetical protein